MQSGRFMGAAILSGIAAYLTQHYAPSYVEGVWLLYDITLWLAYLELWQLWLGYMTICLWPEHILGGISKMFDGIIKGFVALVIAIKMYIGTVEFTMFWKKKTGIYGSDTFMSKWDMWKYWYNSRNHGWSIGNKSVPREEGADGDTTYTGLLVLGPPRVGKSSAIAVMSILRFISKSGVHSKENGEVNLVVNDPSGQLFDTTSAAAKHFGYDILRLCTNVEDRNKSIRFNPLEWCKDTTDIAALAEILISMQEGASTDSTSKYFMNGAKTILTAILTATWLEEPIFSNLPNAYRLLLEYASDQETIGQAIEARLANNEILRLRWTAIQERPQKELGGLIGTAENALAFTGDPTIAFLLSGNDFTIDDLRNRKMVLYNQFDENDKLFKPVNALLLSYAFGRCMQKQTEQDELYRPVMFFLEECYTLGYVPGLSEFAGNCRKYKCGLLLIFQGLGQLDKTYGSEAKAVTDGVRSMVIFRGLNPEYYEKIEKVIGYRTEKDDNGQERKVPLISVQAMEKMPRNVCLIKVAGETPIKTTFKGFYSISKYKKLADMGAVEQPIRDIEDIPYLQFYNSESQIINGYEMDNNQDVDDESNRDLSRQEINSQSGTAQNTDMVSSTE